jgi:predicted nucleotidyltransferase
MNEQDKALIVEFKNRLSSDLKAHLKQIIIYGSRAKGNAPEDSDLDVIALVENKTSAIEIALNDLIYQVMWDHDFRPIISLKVFGESEFRDALNKGFSFYRNVDKEGILV